jgi:hypothetical protein
LSAEQRALVVSIVVLSIVAIAFLGTASCQSMHINAYYVCCIYYTTMSASIEITWDLPELQNIVLSGQTIDNIIEQNITPIH